MVTRHGTRAPESPARSKVSPADRPNVRERGLDRAVATAEALVAQGRGEVILAQDGKVFLRNAICAGCSKQGDWRVDEVDAWCPSCGGLALVALEHAEAPFENGLCRLFGGSNIVHLIRPPAGIGAVCMPNVEFGRLRPVLDATDPTCKRCIAHATGTVFGGTYERTIPPRGGVSLTTGVEPGEAPANYPATDVTWPAASSGRPTDG